MTSPPGYSYEKPRDDLPTIIKWARVLLTAALVPLGISTLRDPEAWLPVVGDINVAVHEFGHMLFMPFGIPVLGETMVILGGSLFQVVFPIIFVGYFLFSRKHRDPHAAMICLWWASTSVAGLAVYVADARARDLTLLSGLTGKESDGHDWYNLLSQWGVLGRDLVYASRMRAVAWLMFLVSTFVGFWVALFWAPRPEVQPEVTAGEP
ncbi:MAG: hypothetical protein AABZ80_01965 [Gemmatimonadota bacterium]